MIPTANGGVNYYRLASFAWEMRKHKNVQVSVFAFQFNMNEPHQWQRDITTNPIVRSQIESLCEVADVVIWQPVFYSHTLDFFVEMRSRFEKPMLVESDDDYVDVPPWNEAFHSYGPLSAVRQNAVEHLKIADGLVVSTPFLQKTYSQFNKNVTVIENALQFKGDSKFVGWDDVSVPKHKGIRVGWIGGRTHVRELLMIAPVVKELCAEYPDVTFCFVNSALKQYAQANNTEYVFEGIPNVFYTDRNVAINRYAEFMASQRFDIGMAPLEDCNFNRAKSNLRWLEYSALKIPTVATKISHFEQTITPGHDGMLVPNNDLKRWKSHLKALIDNETLRREMGRNAYKTVKEKFNVRKRASEYLNVLKDISGYGQATGGEFDESDSFVYPDRGFGQRPEPRQVLNFTN